MSDKQRSEFLKIDERLEPKLHLIEDTIDRFRDKSDSARRERYANLARMADLRDWNGNPLTELGDRSHFETVARNARLLIDSIAELVPRDQDEFADILGAYGHPQIKADQSLDHIHPDMRNYITILERIEQKADDLKPDRRAGQPQRYTHLIETLMLVCGAVGMFEELEDGSTGSKGVIGRLLSLCLEIAGVPDDEQPDHGKAIRNALNYIDAGEAEVWREYAEWQESVRKNRGE